MNNDSKGKSWFNTLKSSTATIFICLTATALNAQNLVVNGNLAGEGFADWTLYNPTGENGGNAGALGNPTGLQFPPGTENAVGLAGYSALYQDITTVPGLSYEFSFYATAYTSAGGTSPLSMVASFGSTALPELTLNGSQTFQEFNYEVTATSTSTMVQFSNPTGARWPMFTDVSVVEVPEPGTLVFSVVSLLLVIGRLVCKKMRKDDEVASAPRYQSEPKAFRDGSGVAGRRISHRRFGERLRCFGRAIVGAAQSLLV